MKVLSRDVHRILRSQLGRALRPLGFRTLRAATFAVSRPEGDRFTTVWSQCDKYGWEDDWGCSFTLELQRSSSEAPAGGSILERARVAHLLPRERLEEVRALNNSIIEELPGYMGGRVVSVVEPNGKEVAVRGFAPANEPYPSGADVWFHYSSTEHVQQWASLTSVLLPHCLSVLRARVS